MKNLICDKCGSSEFERKTVIVCLSGSKVAPSRRNFKEHDSRGS